MFYLTDSEKKILKLKPKIFLNYSCDNNIIKNRAIGICY